jgi:hypothetical protein
VARLKDENRDLRTELTALHASIRGLSGLQDLTDRLTPTTDVLALLGELLASVLTVVNASDGSLMLVDEETKELVFAVVHGQAKERLTGYRLSHGSGIAGWVAFHRQPQIVQDVRRDKRFRRSSTRPSTFIHARWWRSPCWTASACWRDRGLSKSSGEPSPKSTMTCCASSPNWRRRRSAGRGRHRRGARRKR